MPHECAQLLGLEAGGLGVQGEQPRPLKGSLLSETRALPMAFREVGSSSCQLLIGNTGKPTLRLGNLLKHAVE